MNVPPPSPYYIHFVPYQEDVDAALQALRQEVFERGEYTYKPPEKAEGIWKMIGWDIPEEDTPTANAEREAQKRVLAAAHKDQFDGLSPEEEELAKHLQTVLAMLALAGVKDVQPPKTIEELLEAAGEEGTRSILDIERVGRKPGCGVAGYLPSQELWKYFGNTQPTRPEVERTWPQIARRLSRWEAIYITVYKDHQPHEYAFIGCAGLDEPKAPAPTINFRS